MDIEGDKLNEFERYVLTKYELNNLSEETLLSLQNIPPHIKIQQAPSLERKELLQTGSLAPNWTLESVNGETVSLLDFRGDLVLLDFFYTSCPPCIETLPILNDLYSRYGDKGLHVIGVSTLSLDTKQILQHYIEKHDITYPIFMAKQDIADLYKVTAYPTTYLIGRSGEILFQDIGLLDKSKLEKIENVIQSHLVSKHE